LHDEQWFDYTRRSLRGPWPMRKDGDQRQFSGVSRTDRDAIESAIRLVCSQTGRRLSTAAGSDVVLASSNARSWQSPLVFELHRMSDHEYGEHTTLGHQLMINLGGPVRLGWLEDGRRCESVLRRGQMCIQSDGDSNAPRWSGELTFATASIDPSMIEALLGEDAPCTAEVFPKRHCIAAGTPVGFARALAEELLSPTEPLYAETLSLAFVLQLLAGYGRATGRKQLAPKGKLGALQLRAVIDFAHEHLASRMTLALLARAAGYSPFQFSRLFKATTGRAPHQFVLSLRLERARRLLETETDLTDVGLKTGFYDQAHFTNAFRKAYGITPSAYARRFGVAIRKFFQSPKAGLRDDRATADAHDSSDSS
jgi:AraC family transcriptional regulator